MKMNIATFRDWTVSIGTIIFISLLLLFAGYTIWSIRQMNQQVASYATSDGQAQWGIYTTESINCYNGNSGKFIAEITMQNTGTEAIDELTCKVYDSGILKSDKNSEVIKDLQPGSSDLCMFEFTGDADNTPVKFEFSYGNVSYRRVCMAYGMQTQDTITEYPYGYQ